MHRNKRNYVLILAVAVVWVWILLGSYEVVGGGEQGGLVQITQHFLSPEGQKQFWIVSAVNFLASLGLAVYSGQWDNLIENPEGWCKEDTALWEFRWRRHRLINAFGTGAMISLGEASGVKGDWGLSYLFGSEGAVIGALAPCLVDQSSSPAVKTALILTVPPIASALLSFYGFYSHADLSAIRSQ